VASVPAARELAFLPNGDLLVGTYGSDVYLVPDAEAAGMPGAPVKFIHMADSPAQGVAVGPNGFVYVATQYGLWKVPYTPGDQSELDSSAVKIASVRTGNTPPGADSDVHRTSSVAISGTTVYLSVGSSCNACTEIDPTRATIQQMDLDGQHMTTLAMRIRNAVALAVNPATGTLWAGGAGQDALPGEHPYEYMDAVTVHPQARPLDYGWPSCEENQRAYVAGSDCTHMVVPMVEFVAFSSHLGASFYPADQTGPYRFPAAYLGGLFVGHHGSWHANPATPPSVSFVPMSGDGPMTGVDWGDPTTQWTTFMDGMGTTASTTYTARPTGVAVGPQGSLFVADDLNGAVYRVRPSP
jgi:glucose/arabinose dehydrogenase